MAGVDHLIDHLLSEIALTGVQGMHDSRDPPSNTHGLGVSSRCVFSLVSQLAAPHSCVAGSLTSYASTESGNHVNLATISNTSLINDRRCWQRGLQTFREVLLRQAT